LRFGVAQARRAWLEPHNVLNTRSLSALKSFLRGVGDRHTVRDQSLCQR
jgi:DNA polymerase (family 10)